MKKLTILILLAMAVVCRASAQNRVVTGTVSEEDGTPLTGAVVQVVGTNNAATAAIDGLYTLKNVPSGAVLRVSFLGYDPVEKKVDADRMDFILKASAQEIASVVVTGMQKMDKRIFTGATDQLLASDVKLDGISEISRGLEGRSAGVSVQNVSGTFGAAPKIRIRGATSIFGDSKPLWVVDGVIMEDVINVDANSLSSGDATTLISSAIAGLNADDIESFQILKDGSATSIYGARAMAGVIVITTKKGTPGITKVSYTGEFTMRMVPSYSNFNIMNSQEQMAVYQEMYDKGWLNYANTVYRSESGVYGKLSQLINTYDPATGQFAVLNTPEGRNAYLRQAEFRNTDWFKELFRNSIQHSHSASISSGSEKGSYYASVGAMVDPGWSIQSKVNRYTLLVNTTQHILKDKLTLNLIGNASYREQRAPGSLSSEVDPVFGTVKRDFDINPYSYAMNSSRTLDPDEFYTRNYAPFNILDELGKNYIDLNVVDTKFQAELRYKPVTGLELSALAAIKYSATTQEHNITDYSNQARAYRAMATTVIRDNNPFLYTDPDNAYAVPISILPKGGIYKRRDNNMLSYDFRFAASYNTEINNQHIINLYGGMEVNQSDRHESWFNGWGMQYSMGLIPFYAYEVFKKGKEENTDYFGLADTHYRNVAFFFNGTYSWNGRYTLNGTFRYEGTNRMGKSRSARWLPTWNVAGAWNVHEENFFEALRPALSHLSLKASYSLTADRGPSFVTNSRVVITSNTPWRPSAGVTESGLTIYDLENSELTYEKKNEVNVGIDMGFLNNRISLAADWYKRDNHDLIGVINTQGIGGQVMKYGNVAGLKSSGVELTLSTRNIETKNFSWSTDFIYSHLKEEVTDLMSYKRAIDLVSGTGFGMEGYPSRSIFSFDFQGLNDEGIPQFINEKGQLTTTSINFQERNNLGHLKYSGTADPTDFGSFGNMFRLYGFKLNVFITYSFGNVIRLDPVFSESYSDLLSMPREFRNRWMRPGDENHTDIPVIANKRQVKKDNYLSRAYNAYNYSTARIAKGDFIRMKEISLTYDFPKRWIKKLRFSNMSLKLQATNLFLIYADKKLNGQDPEFFNTGGVAVPVPKQFTLTLKIGL